MHPNESILMFLDRVPATLLLIALVIQGIIDLFVIFILMLVFDR